MHEPSEECRCDSCCYPLRHLDRSWTVQAEISDVEGLTRLTGVSVGSGKSAVPMMPYLEFARFGDVPPAEFEDVLRSPSAGGNRRLEVSTEPRAVQTA